MLQIIIPEVVRARLLLPSNHAAKRVVVGRTRRKVGWGTGEVQFPEAPGWSTDVLHNEADLYSCSSICTIVFLRFPDCTLRGQGKPE